ncbi:MAG: hypothetical protein JWO03_811 [Bacteroidetes bacterium]|nr:hypothetical protein [Bacteroidota bacterium]
MAAITLIGSGNTATALGKALKQAGHQIIQVWSRSAGKANELAGILGVEATADLSAINDQADVYLVAVKDDAIESIGSHLKVGGKVIAHTSGIKSRELLKEAGNNYGVFYPFVSMTKETAVDFKRALVMIEGSNQGTSDMLSSIAKTISDNVKTVEQDQRQVLHLSAVFVNNFSNHLYSISEKILTEKGLSFDDMRPLIAAHTENVMKYLPSALQTGPAVRDDRSTIDIHMDLLSKNQELKEIYSLLTSSIQDFYKRK